MHRLTKTLILFLATTFFCHGAIVNSSNSTATFEKLSIGMEYRVTFSGTWGGATAKFEVWNEELGNYFPSPISTFSEVNSSGELRATGKKFKVTLISPSGSTSLQVEALRLPVGGFSKLSIGSVVGALGFTPANKENSQGLNKTHAASLIPTSFTTGPVDQLAGAAGANNAMFSRCPLVTSNFGIQRLQASFPNYSVSNIGVESKNARIVVRASVEYPSGIFRQLFFSGKRDVSIDSGSLGRVDKIKI